MGDTLYKKLVELGQKKVKSNAFTGLDEFVEGLDSKDMISLITERIDSPDGAQALNYLILGFSQKGSSQKKRLDLFEAVLNEIQMQEVSSKTTVSLTSLIAQEINKLSPVHLVKITDICVDYIRTSSSANQTSWKELLPKILSIVAEKKELDYAGTEVSGVEFKHKIVQAICSAKWNSKIVTPMAAMFIEIQMTTEEHQQVVNKLCSSLENLSPEEIPPLVHQLLQLCKDEHAVNVFLALSKYFNTNIYGDESMKPIAESTKNSVSDDTDSIVKHMKSKDLIDCESMVLYHIEECAILSRGCVSQLLRLAKTSVNCPEIILDPFILTVLLSLSSISVYEAQVLEVLKGAIYRCVLENDKKQESAWLREMVTAHCDVYQVLKLLIQSDVCERDKVLKGLVKLCMTLLNTSPVKGKEQLTEKVWNYGCLSLVLLVKQQRQVGDTVLQSLSDRIIAGQNVIQYTRFLHGPFQLMLIYHQIIDVSEVLSGVLAVVDVVARSLYLVLLKMTAVCTAKTYGETSTLNHGQKAYCVGQICNTVILVALDNLPILVRLLDFLNQLPAHVARRVISSMLVVVRISHKLRDNLILVLRKALFSREVETRKMAVTGFLQLLKYLRVKGLAALSQSQNSFTGPSVFTQLCIGVHTQQPPPGTSNSSSNEAICLEVLGVLRRCFMQQPSVKICLYEGLNDALHRNPELCPSVMDILLDHFNQFYDPDENVLPPLFFSKTVVLQGADAILQEPIGKLIFAIQQVVVKATEELGDDDSPRSLDKLTAILESMVNRFAKCDISHFQLDEEVNLLDTVPESLQKQELIRQILGVYEALMAYVVSSWTYTSTAAQGHKWIALFKVYGLFVDYVKNYKSAKKDLDGAPKKGKAPGKKPPPFKLPETVMDFGSIYRMLTLLLSDSVPWASDAASSDVKGRRPLHRYAIQAAVEIIARTKAQTSQLKTPTVLKPCIKLAKLLFDRCLRRFNDYTNFELSACVLALECFTEIFALVAVHFKDNLPTILAEIVEIPVDAGYGRQLKTLIKAYETILVESVDNEDFEEDPNGKKLIQIVISGLSIFVLQIPVDHPKIGKVLDWVIDFAQKKSLPGVVHVKNFMILIFTLLSRCKPEVSLLDSISLQLSHVLGSINSMEVEEPPTSLNLIEETTASTVLPLLCTALTNSLDQVEWLIVRLRSELALLAYPGAIQSSPNSRRNQFKHREKSLVMQLGYCINVTHSICVISVPQGPCTEAVFKLLSRLYLAMTSITKYFSLRSSAQDPIYQEARFGKIVKLAGSYLSTQVSDLIIYVEDHGKNEGEKKVKESHMISQTKKQAVFIPRLVADQENFAKCVTILSNKCKDKILFTNLRLTSTRDFRLNVKKLTEVMNRNKGDSDDEADLNTSRTQNTSKTQNTPKSQKTLRTQNTKTTQNHDESAKTSTQKSNKENVSQKPPRKKIRTITDDDD